MKRLLLFCSALMLSSAPFAQSWEWGASTDDLLDGSHRRTTAMAADANGNNYACGGFKGTTSFGMTTLEASEGLFPGEVFVAKHDTDGNLLWELQSTGGTQPEIRDAVLLADGRLCAVGRCQGTISFGDQSFSPPGSGVSGFVLIVSPSGTPEACYGWGIAGFAIWESVQLTAVAQDASGHLIIGGNYGSTVDFGGVQVTHPTPSSNAPFILSCQPDGTVNWVTPTEGGTTSAYGYDDLAIGANGDIWAVGSFKTTLTFPGVGDVVSTSHTDMVFARYSSDGTCEWAMTPVVNGSSSAVNNAKAVAVTPAGEAVFVGWFGGEVTFGSTLMNAGGFNSNGFVAKCDVDGTFTWAHQIGNEDSGTFSATDIVVGGDGSKFICGGLGAGGITVAGNPIEAGNGDVGDVMVLKINAAGEEEWALLADDPDGYGDGLEAIVAGGTDLFVGGFHRCNLTMGPSTLETSVASGFDGDNALVAKIGDAVALHVQGVQAPSEWSIFPIPAQSVATVSIAESVKRIVVTDIEGRVIHTQTSRNIALDGWASGVYLVKCQLLDGRWTSNQRLMVQ